MTEKIPCVSREELQRIMLAGTHLHQFQGKGQEGLLAVIEDQGSVQLDPLNPAGRNHDLFFLSRIPDYKQGEFERTCFSKKLIFEYYFPNLYAIHRNFFPLFHQIRDRRHLSKDFLSELEKIEKDHPELLEKVLVFIKKKGSIRISDFDQVDEKFPGYKSWKDSYQHPKYGNRMFLWLLMRLGYLEVIEHEKNFQKVYGLTSDYFDLTGLDGLNYREEELQYQLLKLKLRSYPVIDANLRMDKQGQVKSRSKKSWLSKINLSYEELLIKKEENDRYQPALVYYEENSKFYIVPSNWEDLVKYTIDDEMRAIAPLDPLVWDREILTKVFGFDYMWEVYKKPKDRIWGYYVYPLLYKGRFIGRTEAKFDKNSEKLELFNLTLEKQFSMDSDAEKAMNNLLNKWKEMLGAEEASYEN
ncbi:MAG: DNA glycosylase AlkZ-like family protein [Candidatus Odinarchaeota archaeon]